MTSRALRSGLIIQWAEEHLYADSADLAATAGGLLLTFRQQSSMYILRVLDDWLRALAKLSCLFQSASVDLSTALDLTATTIDYIESYAYANAKTRAAILMEQCQEKGIHIETNNQNDSTVEQALVKYNQTIVTNLRNRFNDDGKNFLKANKLFISTEPQATFTKQWLRALLQTSPVLLELSDLEAELPVFRRWIGSNVNAGKTTLDIMRDTISDTHSVIFPTFAKIAVC